MFDGLLHRSARRDGGSQTPIVGSYVTNGRRLFRVACRVGTGVDDLLVSLEDCLTLEVRPCTPRELDAIGLRPVATSDGGAIASESIETYSPQDRSSAAVRVEARASAGGT